METLQETKQRVIDNLAKYIESKYGYDVKMDIMNEYYEINNIAMENRLIEIDAEVKRLEAKSRQQMQGIRF